MSRRRAATKREILPDPKYASELLAQFINQFMKHGKKSVAEKTIYAALDIVVAKSKDLLKRSEKEVAKEEGDTGEEGGGDTGGQLKKASSIDRFQEVLEQIRPTVEVRSRRVGGATYQIPVEIRESRSVTLAMRWLIDAARKRSEKGMVLRLANEILDALQGRGNAVKKREETHRMAKANQAFAHFRW